MKLVEQLMNDGVELNMTGNGGVHYNGVKITEVWDDFIAVEVSDSGMRQAGQFRGGKTYVNLYTITRIEHGGFEGSVQDSVRRRLR